jgi:hypothetical protein
MGPRIYYASGPFIGHGGAPMAPGIPAPDASNPREIGVRTLGNEYRSNPFILCGLPAPAPIRGRCILVVSDMPAITGPQAGLPGGSGGSIENYQKGNNSPSLTYLQFGYHGKRSLVACAIHGRVPVRRATCHAPPKSGRLVPIPRRV